MKKLAIIVIALAMLVSGFALADPGMKAVPETQGIIVSTTVYAGGEITSDVSLDWTMTNIQPLNGEDSPPPLDNLESCGSTHYKATFEENTVSTGIGGFYYDTSMDIETGEVITDLSNIEAEKQIIYATADDGQGRIVSSDEITLNGAGLPFCGTHVREMCPFSPGNTEPGSQAFCNYVQMGNEIDMDFTNTITSTDARFVTKAADFPVEVNHDIAVTQLGTGFDSSGTASAYVTINVKEGRNGEYLDGMFEAIEFTEDTSFTGTMTEFIKNMHYESGPVR